MTPILAMPRNKYRGYDGMDSDTNGRNTWRMTTNLVRGRASDQQ
jgi:hypothetical protein